ncbi:MAG: plasmid replication initiator TrfA [Methylophilus sp.]|uniref:plasmid replication initiator TrfA n=1 Tax=Methylophilus sp. TaxID=29541 RepID=UPI003F9FB387
MSDSEAKLNSDQKTEFKPDSLFAGEATKQLAKSAMHRSQTKAAVKFHVLENQMPLWGHSTYGIPRSIVRSSLFGTNSLINIVADDLENPAKVNSFRVNRTIESLSNYTITYSGFDLNQEVLDFYLEIIDIHSKQQVDMSDADACAQFTGYELFKKLNPGATYTTGGESYNRIRLYLQLLQAGKINIECYDASKTKTAGFQGSLIRKFEYATDSTTGKSHFLVYFEKEIINLFQDGTVEIFKEHREKLGKKQLAKWLLNFYASHSTNKAVVYDIKTIRALSGSNIQSDAKFKQQLKKAIEALGEVGLKNCPSIVGHQLKVL